MRFRPEAEGWGQRSELKCAIILGLRPSLSQISKEEDVDPLDNVKFSQDSELNEDLEPVSKTIPPEDYEALLDDPLDDLDLSGVP